MFTAADLAKCLFERFDERMYHNGQIFLRSETASAGIPGNILVTFKLLSSSSRLLVLIESSSLDKEYVSFMSNGGIDEVYKSVSENARNDLAKHAGFLRGESFAMKGDKCQYECSLSTEDVGEASRALFNACIRPALYYVRKCGGKV